MNVGELLFSLKADTAQLRSDMGDAKKQVGEAMEGIKSSVETATRALELFGIGLGAHEVVEWINHSIEMADQAGKTAQKIGITTEELSRLHYAAQLSDVSNEQLDSGLEKFNKTLSAAAAGSKEQALAFADLGVKTKDANGNIRDTDSVLLDVAEKFANSKDDANKTAEAIKLFGKSGAELIPFLNQGKEGIAGMSKEANAFGITISGDTAHAAAEFKDNLKRLHGEANGFANSVAKEMLPELTNISKALVDYNKGLSDGAALGDAITTSIKTIIAVGSTVAVTFEDIGSVIGATAAATVLDFKGIGAAIEAVFELAIGHTAKAKALFHEAGEDFAASTNIRTESSNDSTARIAANDEFINNLFKKSADVVVESEDKKKKSIVITNEAANAAAEALEKKINDQIAALQLQAAHLGATSSEMMLYRLQSEGANAAQLALAKSAVDTINAFSAQQDALKKSSEDWEKFDSLREGAMTAEERAVDQLKQKYAELDAIVKAHPEAANDAAQVRKALDEQEIIRETQKQAALGDVEAQWEVKRRKFAEMNASAKTSFVLGQLTQLSAGMAQHNRAMFEINKAASIANAISDTYAMAVASYKAMAGIPYVGPVLGAAAAAAAIAFGMAQVSAISSSSFSGGGGGTTPSASASTPVVNGNPVSSSGPTSNGATAVPTTQIIIQGDLVSNHAETTLQDLKNLINPGDHVLLESTSRQAAELKAA